MEILHRSRLTKPAKEAEAILFAVARVSIIISSSDLETREGGVTPEASVVLVEESFG